MRTGASLLKIAVAVAIVATVSSAMAQGGGKGNRGGGRGGFGINAITVAKVEGVQKDLELSTEQKDSLAKLEPAAFDPQSFQNDREAAMKKMAENREADAKKVEEILMPPQRDRFAEIMLQLEGTGALRQEKVAAKLKLTDEQKTKLGELFAQRQGGGGGGGGNFQQAREERDAKAMEILTADQKSQFTSMQGKKIEIDRAALMGGGRQGGKGRGKKGPDA